MNTVHRRTLSIAGMLLVSSLAGCTGNPVRVGQVDQPLSGGRIDYSRGRTISASASGFQLLLFIPISINDRQERAYSILRGQSGGDYITDVKVKESWIYALVGTVYKTTLEATAYPHKTSE